MSSNSEYYQYQEKVSGIAQRLSSYARKNMFASFMKELAPGADCSVVDLGVTSDQRADSNFFETFYPYPNNITAVGLEDASFLEKQFPGLKYVQANALSLPFDDKQFDIGVSWAVIEHVGSRENQKKFLNELLRVSRKSFITTPNRWYPIEFHTVTPFLHWLPPEMFRKILKKVNLEFY